jgi:hypothetical protein
VSEPWGDIDIAFQKKWPKKRSNLTFNVSSILNTGGKSRSAAIIPLQNLFVKTDNMYGYGGFSLSFTSNFGNAMVKEKRDRITGAEDEKGRAY